MGVVERRERERTEVREKILDAARELFINEGYEGVSMRKVAQRIEYSPTAIYVYFKDKEDLFHQLCHEDFGKLAAVMQDAPGVSSPLERLKQIGRTYAEFGRRYPNHYKLMFMTAHPPQALDESDRAIKGNPERDAYAFLKGIVEESIAGGYFRPEYSDAELISQTLWAAAHGVISLQIAKCNDAWVDWRAAELRIETMIEVVVRGWGREGG
jgi:AcrR family transcriptional regulator